MDRKSGVRRILRWVVYVAWVVVVSLVGLEVVVRFSVEWSPMYYFGQLHPREGVMRYPFGDIPVNRLGWADVPAEQGGDKPMAFWLGDSVLYGTGTGYGKRITEEFDRLMPELDHVNMGRPGYSGPRGSTVDLDRMIREYRPVGVVYLANLNDIVPDADSPLQLTGAPVLPFPTLKSYSALYSLIAQRFHEWSISRNPRYSPAEHTPRQWLPIVVQTARRVERLAERLRVEHKRPLTVVMVPYEMQISQESADHFRELGIHWEPEFLSGSTQRYWAENMPTVRVIDGYHAFVDPKDPERSRRENPRCRYFVCERGGRLDWNHLTPEGHRVLAEYVFQQGLFEDSGG